MGTPKTTQRFIFQLGDGADPEDFKFTCGANSRGLTLTNNLGETTVLDCEDPLDAVPTIIRYLESQDFNGSIAGTVAMKSWPVWRKFAHDAETKNVRWLFDEGSANNGGYFVGPMMCQQMEVQSEGNGVVKFTANLVGAGKLEWVDAT